MTALAPSLVVRFVLGNARFRGLRNDPAVLGRARACLAHQRTRRLEALKLALRSVAETWPQSTCCMEPCEVSIQRICKNVQHRPNAQPPQEQRQHSASRKSESEMGCTTTLFANAAKWLWIDPPRTLQISPPTLLTHADIGPHWSTRATSNQVWPTSWPDSACIPRTCARLVAEHARTIATQPLYARTA